MARDPGADESLEAVYNAAVYEADLPAGRVTFRTGAPPQGPAPAQTLAILTGWNPGHARPGEAANRAANARLAAELHRAGHVAYPACGRSPDGRHAEPSFAVTGIGAEAALALAGRFGQAAILYWDGRAARILWTRPRR